MKLIRLDANKAFADANAIESKNFHKAMVRMNFATLELLRAEGKSWKTIGQVVQNQVDARDRDNINPELLRRNYAQVAKMISDGKITREALITLSEQSFDGPAKSNTRKAPIKQKTVSTKPPIARPEPTKEAPVETAVVESNFTGTPSTTNKHVTPTKSEPNADVVRIQTTNSHSASKPAEDDGEFEMLDVNTDVRHKATTNKSNSLENQPKQQSSLRKAESTQGKDLAMPSKNLM